MRYFFAALILIHGLIHFMGFSKAFSLADMKQLSIPISKPTGLLWLLTALLFLLSATLFLLKTGAWMYPCLIACVLSQVIIVLSWKDAKYGTIANGIILMIALLSLTTRLFEQTYKKEAAELVKQSSRYPVPLLTDADIRHLPVPVQKYLTYCGVLNQPRVLNMRVEFEGQMREKGKDFFPFRSEQYNFFEQPARLFFMKAAMYGMTVPGYHRYVDADAAMNIRLFGIIPVIRQSGPEMDTTETVTLFNDMCLLAPASLIDSRISWETIDSLTVRAIFTTQGIRISATLYFNTSGQLINFISNDRMAIADGKKIPFSTPVHQYRPVRGFNLISEADAVWEYPEGKFVYGKFILKDIRYNLKEREN
jgi:hypothetical protein